MMPNKTYELKNIYFQPSCYSTSKEEKEPDYPSLLAWPTNGYFSRLNTDRDLLREALSPRRESASDNLSERVFGSELKNQYIDLKHVVNLLQERIELHRKHLQEIDERHIKVQENLFGVEINRFPDRNKQRRTLEGQLIQLEGQRREEEIDFWKDTVELRKQLFEASSNYRDTKHRYSVFSQVEETYG